MMPETMRNAGSNEVERSSINSPLTSVASFVGRTCLSAIFLISGLGKLAAPAATIGFISSMGLPFPQLGLGISVCVEILGGLALLAGYHARVAAGVLAAFSIATAIFFHAHFADQNQLIHFLKNVAMAGGMLQVVAFGAGPYSVDARRNV
jgi:putative oxidoreductase